MEEELEVMVYALLGEHPLEVKSGDFEVPGFPYCAHDRFIVRSGSTYAQGRTRAGALAAFLGVLLDGAWYPMT